MAGINPFARPVTYPYTSDMCPGHVASDNDLTICRHCGESSYAEADALDDYFPDTTPSALERILSQIFGEGIAPLPAAPYQPKDSIRRRRRLRGKAKEVSRMKGAQN